MLVEIFILMTDKNKRSGKTKVQHVCIVQRGKIVTIIISYLYKQLKHEYKHKNIM